MTNVIRVEKGVGLRDHEIVNRAAPGGRLPSGLISNDPRGDAKYTQIGPGSPAAAAGEAEHRFRRERPDLVAKRQRGGK